MKTLFLFAIIVVSLQGYAQTEKDCLEIMRNADSAIAHKEYSVALTKLRAFKICNPGMAGSADDKIAGVFNQINAERDSADKARQRADEQTKIAMAEKAKAQAAEATAEHQAYLAQLAAMSSNLLVLNNEQPTLAFRLACLAYEKNPSTENATILYTIITDTTTGLCFFRHPGYIPSYALNDEDSLLYLGIDNAILEYKIDSGYRTGVPLAGKLPMRVVVSPAGLHTLTCDADGQLSLYRNAGLFKKATVAWPGPAITGIRWSHDGQYIFLLSTHSTFHVLDTGLNVVFRFTDSAMIAFDMSADLTGLFLSHPQEVILRDTADTGEKRILQERDVVYLACTANRLYTTRRDDGMIKIWTWDDDGKPSFRVFTGHTRAIRTMDFTPSSTRYPSLPDTILSSSEDGKSILWTSEGKIIRTMKNAAGYLSYSSGAVLSTGGKRVIAASTNDLCVWDLNDNPLSEIGRLSAEAAKERWLPQTTIFHNSAPTFNRIPQAKRLLFGRHAPVDLQFSPAGDFILVWAYDKAILFDTAWQSIKDYYPGNIITASFSTTGDSIYFLGSSGVGVYYTLTGLQKSRKIYDLSIEDRLKYNVPGTLKEVIKTGHWSEYDQCIFHYYSDYFSTRDAGDLYQLNYLSTQSNHFFQRTVNYFHQLEIRIPAYDQLAKDAGDSGHAELVGVLQTINSRLKKEQQLLSRVFPDE